MAERKGNVPTAPPLADKAREVVKRRCEERKDRRPCSSTVAREVLSRRMRAWKAAYGLPDDDEACFHSTRHAHIGTTMRYARLAPNEFDAAPLALDN